MMATPSTLSLIAGGFYCVIAMTCLAAAMTAARTRQGVDHWRTWLGVAALFALFAALRFTAFEEMLKDLLRAQTRAQGTYGARRSFQAPLVAAILALGGAAALALFYRWSRRWRGRRNIARGVAIGAASALVVLIALRLFSLHALDALLFGPLKLNWVFDLCSSAAAFGAAVFYIRVVRTNS